MTESPDFAQIAREILTADDNPWTTVGRQKDLRLVPDIAEQLRQIWNARGAADVDAINAAIQHSLTDGDAVPSSRRTLENAIREWDR